MKQKHVFLTTNKRTLTTPSSLWPATPPAWMGIDMILNPQLYKSTQSVNKIGAFSTLIQTNNQFPYKLEGWQAKGLTGWLSRTLIIHTLEQTQSSIITCVPCGNSLRSLREINVNKNKGGMFMYISKKQKDLIGGKK